MMEPISFEIDQANQLLVEGQDEKGFFGLAQASGHFGRPGSAHRWKGEAIEQPGGSGEDPQF